MALVASDAGALPTRQGNGHHSGYPLRRGALLHTLHSHHP